VPSLVDILQRAYAETPEKVAVHVMEKGIYHALTYKELLQGAARFSLALAEAGVSYGDPVVIILRHGAALLQTFFGAVLRGAIPSIMPFLTEKLSPERYTASITSLMQITRPSAVITYADFVEELWGSLKELDHHVALLIAEEVVSGSSVADLDFSEVERGTHDLLLLQHSSGTTGLQKGVALSHQAVLNQVGAYASAINMSSEDVVVNWLPLYHDMGLIAGFILPIVMRAEIVMISPFEWVRAPHKMFEAVSRFNGTLTWLPNFAFNFCAQKVRDQDMQGIDLSSWRAVINCSEPMRKKSHDQFIARFEQYGLRPEALATCYAMAENVFAVSQGGIDSQIVEDTIDRDTLIRQNLAQPPKHEAQHIVVLSTGRPIENCAVRILDEHHQPLPDHHVGEIAIKSDCMLTGYFNRDDLTEEAFHEGWYLTGDLGYLKNGELFLTGRRKELIIIGGRNFYPQDIEDLASEVPGIHPGRVVAVGVFDEALGTEEVAVIAEADSSDPDIRRQIKEQIRQTINRSMDISLRYIMIVNRGWVIKTSSGKVARQANRDKYLDEKKKSDDRVLP
jgi:acyl-CoA synthetase (AMP-forming)/AMP-acid ligase II